MSYSYKILFPKYSAYEDIPRQLWKKSILELHDYKCGLFYIEMFWSTYMYLNAIISFIHYILYKNVYLSKEIKWIIWFQFPQILLRDCALSIRWTIYESEFLFPYLKEKISCLTCKWPIPTVVRPAYTLQGANYTAAQWFTLLSPQCHVLYALLER